MSTVKSRLRTSLLTVVLTVPLSGCAALGVYDSVSHGSSHESDDAEETSKQQARASAEVFRAWLAKNERYVLELCASPPGSDLHFDAFEHMQFAVSNYPMLFEKALARGRSHRVANCPSEGQSVVEANPVSSIQAQQIERGPPPPPPRDAEEQAKIERIDKLISRSFGWLFDIAIALYFYGAFNSGEFF